MTPMQWLMDDDTGTSSKTILSVMTATPYDDGDVPYDAGDFGRCYRLLKHFPEWRQRLPEVAAALPIWGPMVAAWDELTAMYEEGERTGWKDKRDPMYHRIKELVDAGRLADGWENPSPGYWKKGRASDVEIGSGVSIRT
jgi:hypothetical protein